MAKRSKRSKKEAQQLMIDIQAENRRNRERAEATKPTTDAKPQEGESRDRTTHCV